MFALFSYTGVAMSVSSINTLVQIKISAQILYRLYGSYRYSWSPEDDSYSLLVRVLLVLIVQVFSRSQMIHKGLLLSDANGPVITVKPLNKAVSL